MAKRKVKPGGRRNISFPMDINLEFLDYLNSQNNFSAAIIKLAIKGFESIKIDELEERISKLEEQINVTVQRSDNESDKNYYSMDFPARAEIISPDEEDDF